MKLRQCRAKTSPSGFYDWFIVMYTGIIMVDWEQTGEQPESKASTCTLDGAVNCAQRAWVFLERVEYVLLLKLTQSSTNGGHIFQLSRSKRH